MIPAMTYCVLDRVKVRSRDFRRPASDLRPWSQTCVRRAVRGRQIDVAAEVHVDPEIAQLRADDRTVLGGLVQVPTGGAGNRRRQRGGLSDAVADTNAAVGKIKVRNV